MIKKVEIYDIPERATHYNSILSMDIKEFVQSGWEVCEVPVDKYKNIRSAYSSYNRAVQNLDAPVSVTSRHGRLFMMRK